MHAIDVNEADFPTQVLEKSASVPVVVDFWAPWCGPCQSLKPILEKLAEEYGGKFLLAKVNADDNQGLSMQFGVRGIPSVKAFYKGNVVNEFSGALPEPEVRKFLDSIIPNDSEIKRQEAMAMLAAGDTAAAQAMLQASIQLDDNNHQAKIDLAGLLIDEQDVDAASELLQVLPIHVQQEDNVKELLTRIELAQRSSELPDKDILLQRINADENDLQARVDMANMLVAEQQYDDALELLFYVIGKDRHFGDEIGRKSVLSIFTLLGNGDERVRAARKRLASLLN